MTLLIDNLELKPGPQKAPTVMEKLKTLGTLLGRALDVAVDLLSNNNMKAMSDNKATLLSGNAPNILSGNAPKLLSGNETKLLSENTTPILSGNTFSMFSNIRVEIHIENSAGAMAQPGNAATKPPTSIAIPSTANAPKPAKP